MYHLIVIKSKDKITEILYNYIFFSENKKEDDSPSLENTQIFESNQIQSQATQENDKNIPDTEDNDLTNKGNIITEDRLNNTISSTPPNPSPLKHTTFEKESTSFDLDSTPTKKKIISRNNNYSNSYNYYKYTFIILMIIFAYDINEKYNLKNEKSKFVISGLKEVFLFNFRIIIIINVEI